jgi:RimJ/RimL family protein N-acetyltransferase
LLQILETDRLILREQSPADAAFILQLVNSPGWLQYIGDRNIETLEAAAEYIRNGAMKSYQQNGFGLYLVKLKETDEPVGICGLIKRSGLGHVDIGFAFLPGHTCRGYGFESASAVMTYARSVLGLGVIVAITGRENAASIKLLNKIGFNYKQIVVLPGSNEELMLFESSVKASGY